MNKGLKQKTAIGISIFLTRYGRGGELMALFSERVRDVIMAGIAIDLFNRWIFVLNKELTIIFLGLVVIGIPFWQFILGELDFRYGFWRVQENYKVEYINPYFERKFLEINNKLDETNKTKNK